MACPAHHHHQTHRRSHLTHRDQPESRRRQHRHTRLAEGDQALLSAPDPGKTVASRAWSLHSVMFMVTPRGDVSCRADAPPAPNVRTGPHPPCAAQDNAQPDHGPANTR